MGQKLKIWATMTSIVLLSGMLGFGFSPDAFAGHTGNSQAKGCQNSNPENSSAREQNPHCDGAGGTIQDSPCNPDSDGDITAQELVDTGRAANTDDANTAIVSAEGGTGNGIIDTQAEYDALLATFTDC